MAHESATSEQKICEFIINRTKNYGLCKLVDSVKIYNLHLKLYTVDIYDEDKTPKKYYMLYGNNPLEPTAEPVELYITNEEKLAKDAFDNTHQLLSRRSNKDQLHNSSPDLNLYLEDSRSNIHLRNWQDITMISNYQNIRALITDEHDTIVLNVDTGEARKCKHEDHQSVMREVYEGSVFNFLGYPTKKAPEEDHSCS